jgi:hypothetical protein
MDIKLTDLIYHQKAFLTSEECDYLINESNTRHAEYQRESCPEASSGVDTYSTFNKVELIIGSEGWNIVHKATEKMINDYHDYLDSFDAFHFGYRESLNFSHQYRLLKYETGAKIHRHIDHDTFIYGSCTFNLNDDYTGGEFSWFKGKHTLNLGRGDALIFPADFFWVHEVLPVTSGTRYSTNSFLMSIPDYAKWEITTLLNHMKTNPPTHPAYAEQMFAKYNIKPRGE